jgi:hypothetical protein
MARPRVFISTDMQMITGVNLIDGDKDDVQSMVHALMYQDKINIVGIASSTSRWQPGKNDEKFIHHVIDEYAVDHAKLAAHGNLGDFKTAAQLHAITYQGTRSRADSTGYPAATEASAAIIKEARAAKATGEKLYVVTWGGVGDLARALHDAPDIASSVRLISSAGSVQEPNAYNYLMNNFAGQKGFWWVDVNDTLEGVYASENLRLPPAITLDQVKEFANGHGNLGTFFYENSQDLRGTGDTYSGLKMGDSPGILYLIDNADNNNPTAESWGGEYMKVKTDYWKDKTDSASALKYSGSNGARTIYEDRAAWLGDFKARFDWLKDGTPTTTQPTEKPAPEPTPTPGDPTPTTPGSALDVITVKISGTEYNGDPNFRFLVDGKTIDATNVVTADYKEGQWQVFTFTGDFDQGGTQRHRVGVQFDNDLYGGSRGDRNLYVDAITFNGQVNDLDATLTSNTIKQWDFML